MADILHPFKKQTSRVLDVGCGDGFLSHVLSVQLKPQCYVALDTHFTAEQIKMLSGRHPKIQFVQNEDTIHGALFDLIVFADVLEHVADDGPLLSMFNERFLANRGLVLISVPAFNALFGSHDRFLGHYRRYTYDKLTKVAQASGLEIIKGGYLFTSLLLPRFFSVVLSVFYRNKVAARQGIGYWNHNEWFSQFLERALTLDNRLLLLLANRGIRLPGLSAWILARERSL